MRKRIVMLASLLSAIFASSSVFAYGPHTALDCLGCHDPHYAKAQKIFKVKNEVIVNPRTGDRIDDVSALCLGCHNIPQFGGAGIKPIHLHMTHPVNVLPNTRIANVPHKLLRKNKLQCVSCHDPHPSNPNWRYLRVDTEGGTKVGNFCQMCHPAKADSAFYGGSQKDIQVFTSMNEAVGPGNYSPWEDSFTAANPTPIYIHPLGTWPNSIAPAYPTVATQPWIYNPPEDRIPDELKKAMKGETLAPNAEQQKQQEFNKGTYEEPHPTKGPYVRDLERQRAAGEAGTQPAAGQPAETQPAGTQPAGQPEGTQPAEAQPEGTQTEPAGDNTAEPAADAGNPQ